MRDLALCAAGTSAGTAGSLEGEEGDALAFLRGIYRDPMQPTSTRLRAASIAIEYERPRLAVTALVNGDDFALRLEKAIERSRAVRVIEHTPPDEPSAESVKERPPVGPSPTPIDAPFPSPRRR
jgi:hypothetical protein